LPKPRSIRGVLLPEEAGDFDREFGAAMAQATQTLDLSGVLQLLERWRRVAVSSRDAQAHRRMLGNAALLGQGDSADEVSTEAWSVTCSRLGLQAATRWVSRCKCPGIQGDRFRFRY
jgi:hypothetical protein